jgi:RHS repeat-associated protein
MTKKLGTLLSLAVWFLFLPSLSAATSCNPNPNKNPNPQSFANPGDFNGDCKSDILWRDTSTQQVYEWLMNGTTSSSQANLGSPASDWVIQGVGDFNGDGYADILWQNNVTGQVYIWLMNGGTVLSSGTPGSPTSDWMIQGVGDFNGDGKADILWRDSATGQLYIWFMNGTTSSSQVSIGTPALDYTVEGVGDFNDDGMADILWRDGNGQVYVWLMNGTALPSSVSLGTPTSDWIIQGVGDFNGDGTSDILWRSSSTGQVSIWFMNGTTNGTMVTSTGTPAGPTPSLDWVIQSVGDFNGDGFADILWRSSSTQQVYIWLMDGSNVSSSSASPGNPTSQWQVQASPESPPFPTTIYSYSASYDGVGNVTAASDSTYNGGSIMGPWTYSYDTLNRLVSATTTAGALSGQNACWGYDSFGNRTLSVPVPCSQNLSPTQSYDSGNHLTGGVAQYDAAGDITSMGSASYLYDAEGRICALQSGTVDGIPLLTGYIYDAEGQRVAKGTITSWSCDPKTSGFQLTESYVLGPDGEELTMLNGSGNWQRTNVFGGGKQLATYDSNGLHFQVTDPLGTRRLQTSALGQPETDIQSLPFGDELTTYPAPNAPTTADDATPLHFTGKERDQESGNDYFGARYYASSMGRFLTPDWSKNPEAVPYADLENPQTLNLYSYAENNPLIHIDADGHCSPQWLCNFFIDLKNQALYGEWTTNTAQAQIHQIDQQEAQNRAASLWQEQHPHQLYPGSIQQDIVFPIGLEGLGGITAEEVPGRGTGTDPSTPIGRRGNPIDVTPGTNSPEVIGGRKFTGHALDQMQGRGIPSSVVEEVITNGTPGPGNDPGTFTHTGDGVQVVTNSTGDVVTVKTV